MEPNGTVCTYEVISGIPKNLCTPGKKHTFVYGVPTIKEFLSIKQFDELNE